MRIAATGITSGVGMRFAEVACERGHELRGLVRDATRADARKLADLGVTVVPGGLESDAALGELSDGAEVALHMAAHVGDHGEPAAFRRVNVEGTRAFVDAAGRAQVKRFVQLSSVAIYGRPERGRVTEEWPRKLAGPPYDATKAEGEELVFRRGPALGLEVTAVRPPVIYGPYDRNFMPRLLRMLERRAAVLIDGGAAPFNIVWVDHLVDVLLLAAERPEAAGEAFNVMDTVGERPPSVREIFETAARAAGLPPPRLSLPKPVARGIAGVVAGAFKLVQPHRAPPFSPWVVRLMTLDVIYDASKARRVLGWEPRLAPLEGIARFARWHRAAGRR